MSTSANAPRNCSGSSGVQGAGCSPACLRRSWPGVPTCRCFTFRSVGVHAWLRLRRWLCQACWRGGAPMTGVLLAAAVGLAVAGDVPLGPVAPDASWYVPSGRLHVTHKEMSPATLERLQAEHALGWRAQATHRVLLGASALLVAGSALDSKLERGVLASGAGSALLVGGVVGTVGASIGFSAARYRTAATYPSFLSPDASDGLLARKAAIPVWVTGVVAGGLTTWGVAAGRSAPFAAGLIAVSLLQVQVALLRRDDRRVARELKLRTPVRPPALVGPRRGLVFPLWG